MQDLDHGLPGTYGPDKPWDKHKGLLPFHNYSKFSKFGKCNTFKLLSSKKTFSRAFPLLPNCFSWRPLKGTSSRNQSVLIEPLLLLWPKVLLFRGLQSNYKEIFIIFDFFGMLNLVQCNLSIICTICLHNRPYLCESSGMHLHLLMLMFPVFLTMISSWQLFINTFE